MIALQIIGDGVSGQEQDTMIEDKYFSQQRKQGRDAFEAAPGHAILYRLALLLL